MNILEALDAALPEIPARLARKAFPKLDPQVIAKEHLEHGVPTVLAKMPGSDSFVRFTPDQWTLLELFDGERSYAEVSAIVREKTGVGFTEDDVKEFAAFLRDQTDLLYQTPLEKNITLKQKLGAHRHKRKRFAFKDVTDITLHRWPRADEYLTRLKPHVQFVYTTWFTLLTLCCFGVMVWMWAGKFDEIWYDSFRFYNFTDKTLWDLVEFWFLFGAMAFFHESAHGMTCKHFGASVEKMEFLLMYFAPTFVCDVTQIWILGERRARIYTIIAGIWADLIICFFATTVWWMTSPGMLIHDFAYKVIMVSGIGVTLLNLNPLIKLDGYYMLSELLGEADLKERSTLYVSEWVRKTIYRLPIEIEYVPRRRRALYIVYAMLSGVYGYLLILTVVLFLYNVLRSYTPEYAWMGGLLLGYLVLKSRIRKLVRFMKEVYLDKKDRLRAWFTPVHLGWVGALGVILLLAPVWPDFVQGRFVLEPVEHAVVRAQVPGVVQEVLVTEGASVAAGDQLVLLRNLQLESSLAEADAQLQQSAARANQARLRYADYGKAAPEQQAAAQQRDAAAQQMSHLVLRSPISGVVETSRLQDLRGRYLEAGTPVAEVADPRILVARIFIPEFELREVKIGARVRLQERSSLSPLSTRLDSISPLSTEIDPALNEKAQLNGIVPPPFYVGSSRVNNDGELRNGMTGTAKIFVRRRSLAALSGRFLWDLVGRRFW